MIFHGMSGVGKRAAALEMGRLRNCSAKGAENCTCHSCKEWRAGNFPDLIVIEPEEKASIGVEAIRNLGQRLSLAPYYEKGARIVIIDAAEMLTPAAQNALLKLIEEPPPRTNIMLIATSLEHLLPTVRSRCRSVFFAGLSIKQVQQFLEQEHGVPTLDANDLAELSGGAIGTALRLHSEPALFDQRNSLSSKIERLLVGSLFERLVIAKEIGEQKDAVSVALDLLYSHIVAGESQKLLVGLERLKSQLSSNVSTRAAFERFALGIGA